MRVLHLHSDLGWGGVEQWLLQLSRHIDRPRVQMEYFSASIAPHWRQAIEALGMRWVPSPRPRKMWSYLRAFREALRERTYDAVHCHFSDHGGVLLLEAARFGVPVRIAHSHIDIERLLRTRHWPARAYVYSQNRLVRRHATHGLAASRAAARGMFGRRWTSDPRWEVAFCGLDLEPFSEKVDSRAIRAELGFAGTDIVLGHVGRFTPQKNHAFLVEIAAAAIRRNPRIRFLWVGDGPLRGAIQEQLRTRGLERRVVVLPESGAVPRLMLGAMDLFLFPSLYEGLGLVLVEAQAAGLPCLAADAVPAEATVAPELMTRLPVEQGAEMWAEAIERALEGRLAGTATAALEALRRSAFNIEVNAKRMEELYCAGR